MAKGDIIRRCEERGLRITEQRRVVAQAIETSEDHPDAEVLYQRAAEIDPKISLATVYRTVKLFEEAGILEIRDFRDGRARYEDAERAHHDHLIDVQSGEIIEFVDDEIERLQRKIAERLGYRLIDHRLELFCTPLSAPMRDDDSPLSERREKSEGGMEAHSPSGPKDNAAG